GQLRRPDPQHRVHSVDRLHAGVHRDRHRADLRGRLRARGLRPLEPAGIDAVPDDDLPALHRRPGRRELHGRGRTAAAVRDRQLRAVQPRHRRRHDRLAGTHRPRTDRDQRSCRLVCRRPDHDVADGRHAGHPAGDLRIGQSRRRLLVEHRVEAHGSAAAQIDRAEPDHLGDRLLPRVQPVLHHDRRRTGDQHGAGGHVDLPDRLRSAQCRSGQCYVRGACHSGGPHHIRPVPLPPRRQRVMTQGVSARQGTFERKSESPIREKARGGRGTAPPVRKASGSGGLAGRILYWTGGTVISAIFVLPLVWETIRSFQPELVVTQAPSSKTFANLSLSNYQALLSGQDDIIRNVVNSLIVAVAAALLTALVATLAGYGFALFRFRGSGAVFGLVLVAFMIPFQAVLTPLFIEMHKLHLLNSLLGLALFYTTFNLPVGVYVMRNSFLQVPRELVDAARVDGATVIKTLTSVFRPLIMP